MKNYIIKSGAWYGGECNARLARSACRYDKHERSRLRILGLRLGLDSAPLQRIVKGGSWNDDELDTRSAFLFDYEAGICEDFLGLRLGLDPAKPLHILLRGGCWFDGAHSARSAYRGGAKLNGISTFIGLRLAFGPVQPLYIVLRGGSWISAGRVARSAFLGIGGAVDRDYGAGLRLALTTRIER